MKKIIFILPIVLALFTMSCEDFLDVNTDPNNPVSVTPDLVLPVGQTFTAQYVQEDRGLNHLGNMLMYNWSESYGFSWYDDEFKYLVNTTFYDELFDNAYLRAMKQYHDLLSFGDEYANYKAIGMIMKAYHFQILVDLYGDVPYFEALQRGVNATPAYDGAEAIYDDLMVQLTEAIAMIKAASGDVAVVEVGGDDVMFGGNMTSWIQFANTLKLRMLTRVSDYKAASYITDELAVITTEGSGFITSDVLVQPGYLNEVNKQNPFWAELGWDVSGTVIMSNDATCATQYVLDYLAASNDPRLDYLYEKPETGHLGVEQGLEVGKEYSAKLVSNIGPGILKSADMGANIFSLAESYFLRAELAQKGFGGDPATLYTNGVIASFVYLGLSDADATTYLSQSSTNNISYGNAANKLEAIITQKWIALNGVTAEQSWFDYTRTGYPLNLPISEMADATKGRPVRLAYPASEITGNPANLPEQPNAFTSKIFWAN